MIVVGADVTDVFVGPASDAEHFGKGQIRFAETAARDENAVTGGGLIDLPLAGFQREIWRIGERVSHG